MHPNRSTDRILAFCHIEKTAGTTLVYLMRRHFGLRHIDLGRRRIVRDGKRVKPYYYGPRDLRSDMRLYPSVRSVSGHSLRPFVDFEEFQDRLDWYTFLRDPVKRFRSQFIHEVEHIGRDCDFRGWLRTYVRDNMMVRKLAGEPDLEAAKQLLAERHKVVALQEHFDESLLLIRQRLRLAGFHLAYPAPQNTAARRSQTRRVSVTNLRRILLGLPALTGVEDTRKRATEALAEHHDEVLESNDLDSKLYEYAVSEIWPKQVGEYGGQEKLKQDVEKELRPENASLLEQWRLLTAFAYRNLAHKPVLWLARRRYGDDSGFGDAPKRPPRLDNVL